MSGDHKEIWLQPWCDACATMGVDRQWCQDDVWTACEECGAKPVRYVLAPDTNKQEGESK